MKTVSVVLISHNAERSIGRVLSALEKQDYPKNKYDVVIVDDNSQDRTVEVIEKFIDLKINKLLYLNIRFIRNETNLGLAKSMNRGIRASSGSIVITLHDDCILLSKDWISKMVKTFELDPKIGIVSSDFVIDFKNLSIADKLFTFAYFLGDDKDLIKEKTIGDIPTISDKCDAYQRKVLNAVGLFDTSFRIGGEDMDLSRKVKAKSYRIVRNNECRVLHDFNKSHREDTIFNHFAKAFKSTEDAVYVLLRYGMPYKFDSFLAVILLMAGVFNIYFAFLGLGYLLAKNFVKSLRYWFRYEKLDLIIPIWLFCVAWDVLAGLGWIIGILKALKNDIIREIAE